MSGTVVTNTGKKIGGFDKWEVNSWLDTLLQGYDIQADKKKMKAIKALIVQKKKYLNLIKIK
jgi:hypothetical protein